MVFRNLYNRAAHRYVEKYIETSSIVPLYHVCFGLMAFSFLVHIPEELRHFEHQKHEKEKGAH